MLVYYSSLRGPLVRIHYSEDRLRNTAHNPARYEPMTSRSRGVFSTAVIATAATVNVSVFKTDQCPFQVVADIFIDLQLDDAAQSLQRRGPDLPENVLGFFTKSFLPGRSLG